MRVPLPPPSATDMCLDLLAHGPEDLVAVGPRGPITAQQFHSDAAALACLLPDSGFVVNLCTDRYRFMVGYAACMLRQQVSLMPAAATPVVLQDLVDEYPGLYALTDGPDVPQVLPHFAFPSELPSIDATPIAIPGDQVSVVLFTSGSTGKPKPVQKTWGVLVNSARSAGQRLDAASLRGGCIVGTVPHQHSYGLESIITLAWQFGLAVATRIPLFPEDVRVVVQEAPAPRVLVTTPVHLRALTIAPPEMPPLALLLSATAPLSPALAHTAELAFHAPLVEIYGCTEAGQIATRRSTQETDWHCFDAVHLQHDENGWWATGPAVEGVAPVHDEIELTQPQHFRLGSRSADLVNIAGKRSSIAYLNHQLLSISGVRDGAFLMPDDEGQPVARLMAFVVAPQTSVASILQALQDRIDPVFLPRPLVMVEQLPRNAMGKVLRADLVALAVQHSIERTAVQGNRSPYVLNIPAQHPTAALHFPGQPVIPGALLIDEVIRVLAKGERLRLRSVKFLTPLVHGEPLELHWQDTDQGRILFQIQPAGQVTPAVAGMLETGS